MKKVFSVSNIFACISFLLALAFLVVYLVNVNVSGFFQGNTVPNVVLYAVLAMVCAVLVIGASLIPVGGIGGKCIDIVAYLLKAAIPVLFMLAAFTLLSGRVAGIGYIYFSNVDVAKEVGTPENLASAAVAISGISVGLVGAVVSLVGAFFLPRERDEEKAQVTVAE